jgi:hypothetical protein
LAVEGGEVAAAKRELTAARQGLDGAQKRALEGEAVVIEARLDLSANDAPGAYRRLKRLLVSRATVDATEAWLLLAIAAHLSGEKETLGQALEVARRRSVDLGPLAGL